MIDAAPPLWIAPKPAIMRPAEHSLLRPGAFRLVTRAERRVMIAELIRTKRLTREEAALAHFLIPVVGWATDISVIDDGDYTAPDSGAGTSTHTFNSVTSSGPVSILVVGHHDNDNTLPSGITWNGNALASYVGLYSSGGTPFYGASIWWINGAQSGNVVVSWGIAVTFSAFTVVSLVNLQSTTAIDTDAVQNNSNLAALSSPGEGGVRLAGWVHETHTTAPSWSNATPISDLQINSDYRFSTAYDLGDDATTISAGVGSGRRASVGVSLR